MSAMWVKSRVWVPGETTVRGSPRIVLPLEQADHGGVPTVLDLSRAVHVVEVRDDVVQPVPVVVVLDQLDILGLGPGVRVEVFVATIVAEFRARTGVDQPRVVQRAEADHLFGAPNVVLPGQVELVEGLHDPGVLAHVVDDLGRVVAAGRPHLVDVDRAGVDVGHPRVVDVVVGATGQVVVDGHDQSVGLPHQERPDQVRPDKPRSTRHQECLHADPIPSATPCDPSPYWPASPVYHPAPGPRAATMSHRAAIPARQPGGLGAMTELPIL